MAPPRKHLPHASGAAWHRLSELDPDVLALEAAELAVRGLRGLRGLLGSHLSLPSRPSVEVLRDTPIYKTTHSLHAWALTGAGSPGVARKQLLQLIELLSVSAMEEPSSVDEELSLLGVMLSEPLGHLCLAGRARWRLATGERLDGLDVAALLSHRPQSVRRLSELGFLKPATKPSRYRGTLYEATDVLSLLAQRGTPGFEASVSSRKKP